MQMPKERTFQAEGAASAKVLRTERAWKPVQLEQSDHQEGRVATRSERQGGGMAHAACWGSGCCYSEGRGG